MSSRPHYAAWAMLVIVMLLPTIWAAVGWIDSTGWVNLTLLAVGSVALIVGTHAMILRGDRER